MKPLKSFRIDPDLKNDLRKAAAERGETESDIIRRALRIYLNPKPQPKEKTQ